MYMTILGAVALSAFLSVTASRTTKSPPDISLPGFLVLDQREISLSVEIGNRNFTKLTDCVSFAIRQTVAGYWNKADMSCHSAQVTFGALNSTTLIRRVDDIETVRQSVKYTLSQEPLKSLDIKTVDATPKSKSDFFAPCDVSFIVKGQYQCQVADKNPNSQLFFRFL